MITRFLTEVRTTFSPFNPKSGKTARNFLALLPPNARQSMKIDIKMMPKEDANKPSLLALKFSTWHGHSSILLEQAANGFGRGWQGDEPGPGEVQDQGLAGGGG